MKMLCVCCQMICSTDVSLEKSVVFLEIYVGQQYCVMQKRILCNAEKAINTILCSIYSQELFNSRREKETFTHFIR